MANAMKIARQTIRKMALLACHVALIGVANADSGKLRMSERGLAEEIYDLRMTINSAKDPKKALLTQYKSVMSIVDSASEFLERSYDTLVLVEMERLLTHEPNLEHRFLRSLSKSLIPEVRTYAYEKERWLLPMQKGAFAACIATESNQTIDFAALRGKVVLVTIWNIWCGSCISNIPRLQHAHDEYADDGLEIIGICVSKNEQEHEESKEYIGRKGITYRNVHVVGGRDERRNALSPFAYDSTVGIYFLFDRDGRLVSTDISGHWLDYDIKRLLASESKPQTENTR